MSGRPPITSRSEAFASLRERLEHADPTTRAALEQAERAYEALAFERGTIESRLTASAEQRERELDRARTIGRVAETINSSLDLDVVLRRVLDIAIDVLRAERGFLMIADERNDLRVAATHGIDERELDTDAWRPSRSTVDKVFATGEPMVTTDAQADPRFNVNLSVRALNLRSIVCVPLAIKDRRIGVVYIDSRVATNLFSRQDPELLLTLANQAAVAIENARLFEEQRTVLAAITDGVIVIAADGTIASLNDAAAATLGIARSDVLGRSLAALDATIPGFAAAVGTSPWTEPREMRARHPRRGDLALEVRAARIEHGQHARGALAVAISDLTEKRALEQLHEAEVRQREAIREAFARYLAPHVVEQLMARPQGVALGGERATATIVFADIVGFTELAGRLDAERVVTILNGFFSLAVQEVFEHDGLLDKFYGDGMMVVFGPPRVRDDDAVRAIRVAQALHRAATTIDADGSPLRLSIGIATGEVVAGHIGSPRRMDYTVIGDAANLASRLQGACPAGGTYVDERTYLRLPTRPRAERLTAKIRGKTEPVTIYALA